MKQLLIKYKYYILIALIFLAVGFFIGRKETPPEVVNVQFIQGAEITGLIDTVYITLIKESKPDPINLPDDYIQEIVDSVTNAVISQIDTVKIVSDFMKRREYLVEVFDNDLGKLTVKPTVQYNSLIEMGYSFTPIYKEVTIKQEKKYTPHVTLGVATPMYLIVGGGIYYKNIGAEYNYLQPMGDSPKGHTVKINVKF